MDKIKSQSKFADKNGEIMILELGGHIDQSNSYQLQKMFDDIITSGCYQVVVDFKELFYMSSAGWGVFIGEIKRFRENGGDIKLANMNPDIQDVFQMLEFFHILEDYVSVQEALSAFKKDDILDLVVNGSDEQEEVTETKSEEQEEVELSIENSEQMVHNQESETKPKKQAAEILSFVPAVEEARKKEELKLVNELTSLAVSSEIKLHQLPVSEKVKNIIAQNPLLSTWGIKKVLKHEHFGYTKIGWFQLAKLLREMDLNSKAKRYRYYRSC
ncbi:MAG: STAS domain-containing protein [Calditrichaceae bacterium]|nr:STAS domain-containing protein [Calditrichaceae bacterium]MBN2708007.1 STAS domain-containing protein [Calditrichaceae bacterium]RQV95177.1 MAG: anti-sigma factor antagonist [Calditrichota bacterium]